jgi:hypothetical protein
MQSEELFAKLCSLTGQEFELIRDRHHPLSDTQIMRSIYID